MMVIVGSRWEVVVVGGVVLRMKAICRLSESSKDIYKFMKRLHLLSSPQIPLPLRLAKSCQPDLESNTA